MRVEFSCPSTLTVQLETQTEQTVYCQLRIDHDGDHVGQIQSLVAIGFSTPYSWPNEERR